MTQRKLIGPMIIVGGTPTASATIIAKILPPYPYDPSFVVPASVVFYVVDGQIKADADGQEDAYITSPANYKFTIRVGSSDVGSFHGSVAESDEDIEFYQIYATRDSNVNTDPSLVREGDSTSRLTHNQYRSVLFSLDEDGGIVIPTDEDGEVTYALLDLE